MTQTILTDAVPALIRLKTAMDRCESEVAKGMKMTVPQARALSVVGREGQPRMNVIAQELNLTTGTVTTMTDRLEQLDYVVRRRADSDRRGCCVELTEKGREVYRQFCRKLTDQLAECIAARDKEDLRRLVTAFESLGL